MAEELDYYEEGQRAFEEGKAIYDYPSELNKTLRRLWQAGYQNAAHEAEKQKESERWKSFSFACPWNSSKTCLALRGEEYNTCSKDNCAPLYFKEHDL